VDVERACDLLVGEAANVVRLDRARLAFVEQGKLVERVECEQVSRAVDRDVVVERDPRTRARRSCQRCRGVSGPLPSSAAPSRSWV
jgi:hypothetical protein